MQEEQEEKIHGGKVIIQTYNPDNFSIECSKEQNYDMFYNAEIKLRKQLKYPPFCDIILFGISGENEKNISSLIYKEMKDILKNLDNTSISIPMPAPIDKIKNKYRWRIILKGIIEETLINLINEKLENIYKIASNKVRVIVDLNPTNML